MNDENELSREPRTFQLPDSLLIEIGLSITLFARLESAMLEAIWTLRAANLAEKQQIAKMSARKGFAALKKFFKDVPDPDSEKLWDVLDQLTDARNLIAHGVWLVDATGQPTVIWHSKMLEADDFVGTRIFPLDRFSHFRRLAHHSLEFFLELRAFGERTNNQPRT